MNLKLFTESVVFFFLSAIAVFATDLTFPQDTVKKQDKTGNTVPVQLGTPSSQGTPEKMKQSAILRPGDRQPTGKEQDPMKQYSKKEFSTNPAQSKKSVDPDEMKAEDLFRSGSRKGSQGDYEGAVADLSKSLDYKKDGDTYMKRALAYFMMDKYSPAIEDLNEAIKLQPSSMKTYFTRGVCYYELIDFSKADSDLSKSIELDPRNPLAFNYKAAIKYRENDFNGALENYTEVIKVDSSNKQAYTNRGMIRHYLKDYKGAIEDYNKALELDPYNATAYNNRGAAKVTLKDYSSAMTDFDAAIQLKEDYADAYGNRGNARINVGDTNGACEDWQKASTLGMKGVQQMISKYCK